MLFLIVCVLRVSPFLGYLFVKSPPMGVLCCECSLMVIHRPTSLTLEGPIPLRYMLNILYISYSVLLDAWQEDITLVRHMLNILAQHACWMSLCLSTKASPQPMSSTSFVDIEPTCKRMQSTMQKI